HFALSGDIERVFGTSEETGPPICTQRIRYLPGGSPLANLGQNLSLGPRTTRKHLGTRGSARTRVSLGYRPARTCVCRSPRSRGTAHPRSLCSSRSPGRALDDSLA